ncbi:MAG: lipocalin-like domain-containing protein [Longimicrobiales bacterium]
MTWSCRALIFALLLLPLVGPLPAHPQARRQSALVGTWRIVEFVDWDSAGRPSYLLGAKPTGYLMYTPTGHVSVHLADTSANHPIYTSYVGKYTVQGNVVTHHIELDSTLPGSSGSGPRPFRLHDDTLVLGDGRTWRRTFVRVR